MSLIDLIVLSLAGGMICRTWFEGSLFADWRAYFQTTVDNEAPVPLHMRLLTCPFCLVHHTTTLLAILTYLPSFFVSEPWALALRLPAFILAAIHLAVMLQDLAASTAATNAAWNADEVVSDNKIPGHQLNGDIPGDPLAQALDRCEDALEVVINQLGCDRHSEHHEYSRADWRMDVIDGNTTKGYWHWVVDRLIEAGYDAKTSERAQPATSA